MAADLRDTVVGAQQLAQSTRARRRFHAVRWLTIGVGSIVVLSGLLILGSRLGKDPTLVDSPLIGRPAPAFDLPTLDGRRLRSTDLVGRPYVVNFWATWCLPCIREHPYLAAFHERWGGRVELIGVVFSDTAENARAWKSERGVAWPLVEDPGSRTAIDFGVLRPPETFIVDADGVVVTKFLGAVGPKTLDEVIEQLQP